MYEPIEIQGSKMFLHKDPNRHPLQKHRWEHWEPGTTRLVKARLKQGDVALDIGAMVGYYTLLFSRLVGKEGKVFAFEPNPDHFDLVSRNVKINNCENTTVVQKAATNKTGTARLMNCAKYPRRRWSIRSNGEHNINTVALDDYFKYYQGPIDLIKTDTEGGEEAVLQGMPRILKANQNIKLIIEFSPLFLRRFGTDPKNFLELIKRHGFKIYMIRSQYPGNLRLTSISELLGLWPPESGHYMNLFCSREGDDAS